MLEALLPWWSNQFESAIGTEPVEADLVTIISDPTVQQILTLGNKVYTPTGFRDFLTIPMDEFDGRSALALIAQGEAERVLAALASDYDGLGY
jgi:hypothetical protein